VGRWHFSGIVLLKNLTLIVFIHISAGIVFAGIENISTALKNYLNAAKETRQFTVRGEPIRAGKELIDFYHHHNYRPVWVSEQRPSEVARELLKAVGQCDSHGLSPFDYHYSFLSKWLNVIENPGEHFQAKNLAEIELLLSDAFLNYGNHLANGKVDPINIYSRWLTGKKKEEIFDFLGNIKTPQNVREILEALAPSSQGYMASLAEVKRLKKVIALGGWPMIPSGKILKKGDSSSRISILQKRLLLEGDLQSDVKDIQANVFDASLEKAVLRFQIRHGLTPDGIVGPQTLAALNCSSEDRLATVFVNLERWRWLPRDLGRRYIIINIAAFELEAYQNGQPVLKMPVIVGEDYAMTPVFSKDMTYLVINPYWDVPSGVLARKILPKIKEDPDYLVAKHFEAIKSINGRLIKIDPKTINWAKINADNFPGRLRQTPGPWNALGRIKFIFPNKFSVYLHDTPERHLFQKSVRAFSSGCIRVKKPIELALYVLKNDRSWDRNRIEQAIDSGKTIVVLVKDPVTIHLLYWTFWVDSQGKANYRQDIYDLDKVLWKALHLESGKVLPQPTKTTP
jgi:murein L,D-transpeptidase YcbB/YkuD